MLTASRIAAGRWTCCESSCPLRGSYALLGRSKAISVVQVYMLHQGTYRGARRPQRDRYTMSVRRTGGYCWSTPFKVLEVHFLGEICSAFLPSKKACWAHQFRYWGVDQQYPGVSCRRVARMETGVGSATPQAGSGSRRP